MLFERKNNSRVPKKYPESNAVTDNIPPGRYTRPAEGGGVLVGLNKMRIPRRKHKKDWQIRLPIP
jgi:hypothetical protein